MIFVSAAAEGNPDRAVIVRIAEVLKFGVSVVHVTNGKGNLDKRIGGFNRAAAHSPWLVLRELDYDANCAGELSRQIIEHPSRYMCFRVAVREVEAWLLADQEGFASHFKLRNEPPGPADFDIIPDPKQFVLRSIVFSRSKDVRDDMLVRSGSGAKEGPAYFSRISDFAAKYWRPTVAAGRSSSLRRCLRAMAELVGRLEEQQ